MIAAPAKKREGEEMQERRDELLLRCIYAFRVLPAQPLVAQSRPQRSNQAVNRSGDQRDLQAAPPRQLWEPHIVVRIHRFLLRLLRSLDGCVWCWHILHLQL